LEDAVVKETSSQEEKEHGFNSLIGAAAALVSSPTGYHEEDFDDTSTLLSSSEDEDEDEEKEDKDRGSSSSEEDEWDSLTVDNVLQPPVWGHDLKSISFSSLTSLEEFLIQSQDVIQQELVRHDYNTFSSFVTFYSDYQKYVRTERNDGQNKPSFLDFVNKYKNLEEEFGGLSCVGLSTSIIAKVDQVFGGKISDKIALVSCEEVVKDVGSYSIDSPNNLKEHVMVALKIALPDEVKRGRVREGYVLMDPGYHVSRPVVVMKDGKYPHTGWFVTNQSKSLQKEYLYEVIDDRFLSWNVRETRRGVTNSWSNLIFIQKQFNSSLSITKKRSLLYAFKSYVIRDRKGPIAGVYWWLRSHSVTLFYPTGHDESEKVNVKFPMEGKQSQINCLFFELT